MNTDQSCPLCESIRKGPVLVEGRAVAAIVDRFPVSQGHVLVIPRRHERDFEQLADIERAEMWSVAEACALSAVGNGAQGANIGINIGDAAGQTVDHVHIHVISRRRGDFLDPRGGIRWVIPNRAAYWSQEG